MKLLFVLASFFLSSEIQAKEIALSFDDAPVATTKHFETELRTDELIRKLKVLKVPPVMVFANPCRGEDLSSVMSQLKKYRDAGHLIGNHTCSHVRLDDVGFDAFTKDATKADLLLAPLFVGQKFFRFPTLNESKNEKLRDQMREWLQANQYRNGSVSIDNDDYLFSLKINQAKEKGKTINYKKVRSFFVEHVVGAANFYDELAVKTMGHSPKHVLLLHEMDATVMFMEALVKALRKEGWKIISIHEAYEDKIYLEQSKNMYANNGLIAQIHMEKTHEEIRYNHFATIKDELDKLLGLESNK